MLLSYFKSIFANLQYVNNGKSHLMRPSIHHFVDVQTTDLEGWYDTIYYLKKPWVAPIGSSNTTLLLATHFNSILFSQNVCTNLDPKLSLDIMKLNFWRNIYFGSRLQTAHQTCCFIRENCLHREKYCLHLNVPC